MVVSLGIGGLAALLLWTISTIKPELAPIHGSLLALALAAIPAGLAYLLLQNLLLGVNQVRTYNALELVNRGFALLLIGVVILSRRLNPELMFAATLFALAVSSCGVLWALRGSLNSSLQFSFYTFRQHASLGMRAYLIAFFSFLVLRVDLVMVKYMLGAQAAGYYSISETMAENILTLPVVVGTILFPRLSQMSHISDKLRLATKAALISAALLLPVIVIAVLVATPAVQLVFGKNFLPAVEPFKWLMPGTFLLGIEIVMVQFLNSLAFPSIIVYSWLLVLITNIGVNFWAIPAYGLTGAALVSTASYSLIFLLVLLSIHRSTRPVVSTISSEALQY